jgi:hypothetical protein
MNQEFSEIPVGSIRAESGTQQRETLNPETVRSYREAMVSGDEFPPLDVRHDGTNFWLVDGFHRLEAYVSIGAKAVRCKVLPGSQRDAEWSSFSANRTHGLPRTAGDKRSIVSKALLDSEWARFSDRTIAEHCGVGNKLVSDIRRQLCSDTTESAGSAEMIGKDGKTYQRAAARGKKSLAPEDGAAGSASPAPAPAPALDPMPAAPAPAPADDGWLTAAEAQADDDRIHTQTLDRLIELERLYKADDTKAKLFDMIRMRDNAVNQQAETATRAIQLGKHNKFLARIVQRCGKAVGEPDNEKIAAAVERLARSCSKVEA